MTDTERSSTCLLLEIMRYRRGIGKYDFSSLPVGERGAATMEAWEKIESEVDAHLNSLGLNTHE